MNFSLSRSSVSLNMKLFFHNSENGSEIELQVN
jgi:hypothetical protein